MVIMGIKKIGVEIAIRAWAESNLGVLLSDISIDDLDNIAKLPADEIAAHALQLYPNIPQYLHWFDEFGEDFFLDLIEDHSPEHYRWLTGHNLLVYSVIQNLK